MMLSIKYIKKTQEAELEASDQAIFWGDIKRACEERFEETHNLSSYCLRMPWWAFLSCRQAVAHVIKKYGIKPTIDANTKQLLKNATVSKDSYETSIQAKAPTLEDVKKSLAEKGFVRQLTDEQLRNVSKLGRLPSGATFSVPGAGKTTEALAFYYYKKSKNTRLFIVAPKNAFAAWEEQLEACTDGSGLKITRLQGSNQKITKLLEKKPQIFIITYHKLLRSTDILSEYLVKFPTFMYLDESHHIKGGKALGAAVLSLSHLPQSKLIMSGTPLPNAMTDLITQFDFLYPEIKSHENTVEALIKPIYVRTTKKELKLPEVKRRLVRIPMTTEQTHLYDLLSSETARQASSFLKARDRNNLRRIGRSVMRLLQLVSNPSLLARVEFSHPELLYNVLAEGDSPKLKYVCQRARKLAKEGRKVLIWSSFVENVEIISQRLADIGADYIHGGVEAGSEDEEDTREAKIKRFHDDEDAYVLVANPAACAEGISLHTVCHYAIYVDRTYNAAQYLQSEDRIHRLGLPQTTVTDIEILCSSDSVDESVNRRLNLKIDRMARVLDDDSLNTEPEIVDLDDEALGWDDILDFIK
jgi:SNF2 family DNA or RNA helicase